MPVVMQIRAVVMATARHAMLATLRGRFGEAAQLIREVAAEGRRAGLADTDRLVWTLAAAKRRETLLPYQGRAKARAREIAERLGVPALPGRLTPAAVQ